MRGPHLRFTVKSVVVICAACFLNMSLGPVSRAIADEPWETWPKKTTVPDLAPKPETDATGEAKTGEPPGEKTAKGKSSGKIWWIAAGTAVAIGIAVAIAGGGGDGGGTTPNPGHQ